MTFARRFLARSLATALALGLCVPLAVDAQPSTAQAPIQVPTPAPMPTTSGTPIPYPAYGTPAPDVAQQVEKPNVPTTVTLPQAVDIAVALAPSFASERAVYAAIAAKYNSAKFAFTPNISASGELIRSWGRATSSSPAPSSAPASVSGYTTAESGEITISELIFDGGVLIEDLRSAKYASEAGRNTLIRQLQT
ncbi:MAG TPA: TolC family protein, partial [Candidatus Acidoferrales bacterium]|nr:TolC family protein [Candidatus Acidoferrales bacterium]